jgi:hypothetical protein
MAQRGSRAMARLYDTPLLGKTWFGRIQANRSSHVSYGYERA